MSYRVNEGVQIDGDNRLVTIVIKDERQLARTETVDRQDVESGQPLLISVEGAAKLLGIGRSAIYQLTMSGDVKSVKVGRRRLVVRASVQEFVDRLADEE